MRTRLDLKIIKELLPAFRDGIRLGRADQDAISKIRVAWDNIASPDSTYCQAVVAQLLRTKPSAVLECGSGLTSVLLKAASDELHFSFIALEHDEVWFSVTKKAMSYLGLDPSDIQHVPLKSYATFDWYQTEGLLLPDQFQLVVCDGPPGNTRGGRFGLLPIMQSRLASGAVILLDDANREGEKAIVDIWQKQFEVRISGEQAGNGFFILNAPGIPQ